MRDEINANDPNYDDPIVAEIRKIREEFDVRFNHDIGAMCRYLRERELLHPPGKVVMLPVRRVKRESSDAPPHAP